jgi:hypothetical protein
MPRAILHIGTEKTGSSAIQAYLAGHRDRLRASGFVYSSIPDSENHVALAAYAQDDTKVDDLRMAFAADNAARLAGFRTRIEQTLAAEVAASPNATFVFSGEHCHSRLIEPAEVERLRDLLRRFFDDIRVIVYLRRQDQVAVSLYSTLVKAGGTRAVTLDPGALDRRYYDYAALLDRWGNAFGRNALTVARFTPSAAAQGSIIPDFCARTGIPLLDHADRRSNESLRPPHQEFLRRINERLPRFVGGALNPLRGDIDDYVSAVGSGAGRRPARATARDFYESFRASNETVRQEFFPDVATLFDENFDAYPEQADPADLSIDDALDITADIWSSLMTEQHGLRARAAQPTAPPQDLPVRTRIPDARNRPILKAPPPTGGVPRTGGGVVNAGYQRDDRDIVDYQLWELGDQKLRGPEPDRSKPYFAAIGAAQVFGRFGLKPFPALIADQIGMQALNLGMSGAGPSFFLQRDELIEAANRAQFVIVQLMSGRSVSNSQAVLANNQGVLWPRADPNAPGLFAEDIYRHLIQTMTAADLAELRAESREIYVEETQALLERIERPKILLYWSKRPVDYEDGLGDLASYWADFPHFVNRDVIDVLKPFADRYVEVVSNRGLPQPLFNRETGAPVLMWPEDRFPNVHLREHNHYYPSPEMNADAADALMPAVKSVAAAPPPGPPKPRAGLRHVLVHMHLFKNAGAAVDRALKEGFDHRWTMLASTAPGEGAEAVAQAADADPNLLAVSVGQIRFPFPHRDRLRFHPLLFLRNPILRARAVYQNERSEWQRKHSDGLHTRMANEHDFRAWIQWCLSEQMLSGPVGNYQTRMCCITDNGTTLADWGKPITLRHFREATTMLANATVGTIEDFDASLIRIERALHPTFPKLRLLSYLEEISVQEGIYPDLGADDVHDELGDKVYNQLCAANALDLLLWRRARTNPDM